MTAEELRRLAIDFTRAFNDNDLDRMMGYFAPDAVYEEFDGKEAVGLAAIREAFAPQFAGQFGRMEFEEDDLFVDPAAGKVMISWWCHLDTKRGRAKWRGLDLLWFADGRLVRKLTYAKADKLKLEAA